MKSKEEILEKYRLYLLPEVFGELGKKDKTTWNGALIAMSEYGLELSIEFGKWLKHLDNGTEHYDPETKEITKSIGFSPNEYFLDNLKSVEQLFLEFTKYKLNEPTTL